MTIIMNESAKRAIDKSLEDAISNKSNNNSDNDNSSRIKNLAEVASDKLPGVAAIVIDKTGIIYLGEAGFKSSESSELFTIDTPVAQFSSTKLITSTSVLQLVEKGLIDLDEPVKNYIDYFKTIGIIDTSKPIGKDGYSTYPPKRDVTMRMLLTHTAGFSYPQLNGSLAKLLKNDFIVDIFPGEPESLQAPLTYEPGSKWEYGMGVDWAGKIVEEITGKTLGEYMKLNIFEPLGMTSATCDRSEEYAESQARLHMRLNDGSNKLVVIPDVVPLEPKQHMGGHAVFCSTRDYAKFLHVWLNDGVGINGTRILKKSTIEQAVVNNLQDDFHVFGITSSNTDSKNVAIFREYYPGTKKVHGLSSMILETESKDTGNAAGTLCWGGLANTKWWVDRKTGIAGTWSTQVIPVGDPIAETSFSNFERSVYDSLSNLKLSQSEL